MLFLGQARRTLGHKKSPWTQKENDQLLANMKADRRTRTVALDDFVEYWDERMPTDPEDFARMVAEFRAAAGHLTKKKDAEVKEGKREPPKKKKKVETKKEEIEDPLAVWQDDKTKKEQPKKKETTTREEPKTEQQEEKTQTKKSEESPSELGEKLAKAEKAPSNRRSDPMGVWDVEKSKKADEKSKRAGDDVPTSPSAEKGTKPGPSVKGFKFEKPPLPSKLPKKKASLGPALLPPEKGAEKDKPGGPKKDKVSDPMGVWDSTKQESAPTEPSIPATTNLDEDPLQVWDTTPISSPTSPGKRDPTRRAGGNLDTGMLTRVKSWESKAKQLAEQVRAAAGGIFNPAYSPINPFVRTLFSLLCLFLQGFRQFNPTH